MTTPTWILAIFAAIMLAVAAISATRLVLARSGRRPGADTDADIDVAHLLMGIAMAGMLLASLQTLPNAAWAVIFAVMTAWFGWCVFRESRTQGTRVLADGHHAPHLVHSAAMLYMFVAITGPARGGSGMAGMGGSAGLGDGHAPPAADRAGVRAAASRLRGPRPRPAFRAGRARKLRGSPGLRARRRRPCRCPGGRPRPADDDCATGRRQPRRDRRPRPRCRSPAPARTRPRTPASPLAEAQAAVSRAVCCSRPGRRLPAASPWA